MVEGAIRRGAAGDQLALAELMLRAHAATARRLGLPCAGHPHVLRFRQAAARAARSYLRKCQTWVVEGERELVAFIALADHRLAALVVDPDRRRRGYGSALLQHARTHREELEVRVAREHAAIGFLRRNGFAVEVIHVDPRTREVEYTMAVAPAA